MQRNFPTGLVSSITAAVTVGAGIGVLLFTKKKAKPKDLSLKNLPCLPSVDAIGKAFGVSAERFVSISQSIDEIILEFSPKKKPPTIKELRTQCSGECKIEKSQVILPSAGGSLEDFAAFPPRKIKKAYTNYLFKNKNDLASVSPGGYTTIQLEIQSSGTQEPEEIPAELKRIKTVLDKNNFTSDILPPECVKSGLWQYTLTIRGTVEFNRLVDRLLMSHQKDERSESKMVLNMLSLASRR